MIGIGFTALLVTGLLDPAAPSPLFLTPPALITF